jgi:hypothetical protein
VSSSNGPKAHLERRAAQEAAEGRRLRGRRPKPNSQAYRSDRKVNLTDPDSRLQSTRDGWLQGYNAQAVVTEDK